MYKNGDPKRSFLYFVVGVGANIYATGLRIRHNSVTKKIKQFHCSTGPAMPTHSSQQLSLASFMAS